jgi:hypothetical protein
VVYTWFTPDSRQAYWAALPALFLLLVTAVVYAVYWARAPDPLEAPPAGKGVAGGGAPKGRPPPPPPQYAPLGPPPEELVRLVTTQMVPVQVRAGAWFAPDLHLVCAWLRPEEQAAQASTYQISHLHLVYTRRRRSRLPRLCTPEASA